MDPRDRLRCDGFLPQKKKKKRKKNLGKRYLVKWPSFLKIRIFINQFAGFKI